VVPSGNRAVLLQNAHQITPSGAVVLELSVIVQLVPRLWTRLLQLLSPLALRHRLIRQQRWCWMKSDLRRPRAPRASNTRSCTAPAPRWRLALRMRMMMIVGSTFLSTRPCELLQELHADLEGLQLYGGVSPGRRLHLQRRAGQAEVRIRVLCISLPAVCCAQLAYPVHACWVWWLR